MKKQFPHGFDAPWFNSSIGRWIIYKQHTVYRELLPSIIGELGLQMGCNANIISISSIRHCLVIDRDGEKICADWTQLPFVDNSIDCVLLTHALDQSDNPHGLLREAIRVLRYEGQLIIVGFNPWSLLKLSNKTPWKKNWIAAPRLQDWLTLLEMNPQASRYIGFLPPWKLLYRQRWLRWIEKAGQRWWPLTGGIYMIKTIKRKHSMRPIKPTFKPIKDKKRFAVAVTNQAIEKTTTIKKSKI